MNLIDSTISLTENGLFADFDGNRCELPKISTLNDGEEVIIGIRPEYIDLQPVEDASAIKVNIELVETLGSEALLHCKFNDKPFVVKAETHGRIDHLENIDTLYFRKEAITVFDKNTTQALPVSSSH